MRKFLSVLSAAVIAITPFSFKTQTFVFAESEAKIIAETVSAVHGESIDITLALDDNPGIVALGIDVSYDKNCLELESVEECKLFSGASFTPSGDIKLIPFKLLWADELSTTNYTDNGKIAVLHFSVLDNAKSGLTEIKINVDDDNTFDMDLNGVSIGAVNGGVNITNESEIVTTTTTSVITTTTSKTTTTTSKVTTTSGSSTKTTSKTSATSTVSETKPTTTTTIDKNSAYVQAATMSAVSGKSVDVALELNGNPGIVALGIDVSYDADCLELESVEDCKLLSGASFTPSGDIKLIPFKLLWADELSTTNYTDNGKIAVLHFKVLDTAKEGFAEIKIDVDNDNTFDMDLNGVSIGAINGGVNITNESVTTTTSNITSVTTTSKSSTTTTSVSTTSTSTSSDISTSTSTSTTTSSTDVVIESGVCGDNLTWTLYDDGTLVISGTGDMEDYSLLGSPFTDRSEEIKNVIIKDGVTSIGKTAFTYCSYITNISIPNSVTSIKELAFYRCFDITNVIIPESVTKIEEAAFGWCVSLKSITIKNSKCEFSHSSSTISDAFYPDKYPDKDAYTYSGIIFGNKNSTAQNYAKLNGCKFAVIGSDPSEAFIIGDANNDGKVNVRDAAFIAKMLAQGKTSELTKSADYNLDDSVNVRDAAAIAKFLASGK